MQILLADDDATTRLTVAAVLKAAGHSVNPAVDGEEAWAMLQIAKFPVVVSDWYMPNLEGPELCRRIRERRDPSYTYFILITARGGRDQYLAAMDAGVDDFVTKPVDAEELVARVRVAERILGLRNELKQLEGLLPICSYCKRIRGDNDTWAPLEGYIEKRSAAEFSHGICPDCYAKYVEPQLKPR